MKACKNIIYTILFSIWSWSAYAADPPAWVENTKITKLSVQPNGNIYLHLKNAVPNLGCANYSETILQLDTSAPNFKEQYSLLLAGFMASRTVNIYVSGCGDAYRYA